MQGLIIPPALLDASAQVGHYDLTSMTVTGDHVKDTDAIVDNLRRRYNAQPCQCYTSIGSILIAVNPWDQVGQLYSDSLQAAYLRLNEPDLNTTLPPHVFRVAFDMYHSLLKRETNAVSVIISGESGAGKTETAKQLTSFVFELNAEPGITELQNSIIQTSAVLEAFGNAKTVRNANSSRFGKLLELQFDGLDRKTCGARIQTFLLEKSRIVRQADGEQNFHVFYALTLFASPAERKALHLGQPWEFKYLEQGTVHLKNDPAAIEQFRLNLGHGAVSSSLRSVGLEFAANDVARVLATVLHIGNISLTDMGENQAPVPDMGALEVGGVLNAVFLRHW